MCRDFGWDRPAILCERSPSSAPDEDEGDAAPELVVPGSRQGPPLDDIFARTGPLSFDTHAYVSALSSYRYAKRSRGG